MKKVFIILLIICGLLISSYSSTGDDDSNKTDTLSDNQGQQLEDSTSDELTPDLPERTFDGAEVHFLVRGGDANEWDSFDIYTEEETGEALNDDIYRRNIAIEDKYDVVIKETTVSNGSAYSTVSTLVQSGDYSYHAITANAVQNFSMATNNLLLDLREVPHINLDNPWWDTALNKDLTILNKQSYAASATNLMAYEATWIGIFNKKLLADYGGNPADIYDMVRNGTWTLTNYMQLTNDYIRDLDNDGKMTSKDQYGTAGQGDLPVGFYIGAGLRYITKDKDDALVFKGIDERTVSILELVTEICKTDVGFNSHGSMNNSGYSEYGRTLMAENRTLFFTETLMCVRVLREMAEDFGVVPMPKYNEEQENYISMVHHWASSLTSIPITCADADIAGIILEEMAYQSYKTVLPTYFNIAINGKALRDEESIEMVDYIMENRIIELGFANSIGITGSILNAIYKGDTNFASIYEKNTKSITKTIEKIMEKVQGS